MFPRGFPVTTGHPPGLEARWVARVTFPTAVLLVALAVILGILLYYAQFSGAVQWLLGVGALAGVALFAWSQIVRRTAEPAPLVGPQTREATREGELEGFAAAVRRAARGLPYSQVLVASRAHGAFIEHARLALGLPPEAMREVQRDRESLRRVFDDDVLVDFLHLRVGDLEERYGWVRRARSGGGFVREFRRVLDRMEAWR